MSKEKRAVGIDLGTTFSVVASLDRDGKPITIPNDEGDLSTPSVVYFDSDCIVVGEEAVNAAEFAPERTARFAKRDMGSDYLANKIKGHSFPPEVVLALVLQKLKADAELKIGEFDKAVITVPAYFNEPRRKATQDAGRMAGIEVLDIINEPTAAAIAFGVNAGFVNAEGKATSEERVLVYDLGGGTFDVTLMDIKGMNFDAIATAGDVHLGGMDWDGRIMHHLADNFQEEHGVDPRGEASAQMKLLQLAGRAKKTLTAREKAQVRFAMDGKSSTLSISRETFESLTEDLVERTRLTVRRMLKDSDLEWSDISRLLLVGGSTRMPMIQNMLEKESGLKCDRSLSPDEAVAHGAAVYAQTKLKLSSESPVFISNVNSHDLGVLGRDTTTGKRSRQLMIARNSKLPKTKKKNFVTSKDGQKEVVVTVVEGGTDTGEGATKIGKCRVSDLPENLPKGTPVFVTFKYSPDGRLVVNAELPDVDVKTRITIQRSSGMSESELEYWTKKIAEGIKVDTDEYPAKPEPIGKMKKPKSKNEPKNGPKKLPTAKIAGAVTMAPTDQVPVEEQPILEALPLPVDQEQSPKPVAPMPVANTPSPAESTVIPVFEEPANTVAESRIVVGGDEEVAEVSLIDAIPDVADDDKSAAKVEESRIIINNDEIEKKPVEHDGLDDFLKNLD